MMWREVRVGKYKGKTLPQIIFTDPDWFFWAIEEDFFSDKPYLRDQTADLEYKARHIKIPGNKKRQLEVEYLIDPITNSFSHFDIVPKNQPVHDGAGSAFRKCYIDMGVPREISDYDKSGYKLFLDSMKKHVFGDMSIKFTKKRCEEFFGDSSNFE